MKVKAFIVASLTSLSLLAQIPDGYYNNANGLSGETLKSALNNIIDNHTEYSYSQCWDALKVTDRDPNNSSNVLGIYSRFSMDAAGEYAGGNGWNREHVWAKSRGDFGTSNGPGTDLHALRAADVSTNSARNNRAFDEGGSPYTDNGGNYSGSTPVSIGSGWTWEPGDGQKGDVARMIFYMATRYEGERSGEPDLELTEEILGNTDKQPVHGRLSTLLQWHQDDPVDQEEINRHEAIYSYQNNRNPYIDHPEYVDLIWGDGTVDLSFDSEPVTTATIDQLYSYSISTSGGSGSVTISATTKPSWATFNDNGDGTATLTGTPTQSGQFPVTLDATDGSSTDTQSFTIQVGAGSSANELIISEYVEGSGFNKALEIANFTGSSVDLSDYTLRIEFNGNGSWSTGLTLSGSLENTEVYVLANSNADAALVALADYSGTNTEFNFNGNDALGLFKGETLIDILGTLNNSDDFAKDVTIVRKPEITGPNSVYTMNEWTSYSKDTFDYLGSHSMNSNELNQHPSVNVTSPSGNATYTTGDNVTVSATASDSDGSITSVEFFVNGNSIGSDTSSPYSATFAIEEGESELVAVATDNDGASTTSASVTITGETVNQAPTVSITSPNSNSTFDTGDNVTFTVNASDADGSISSVQFFVNGSAIATDSTEPFSTSFNVSEGESTLTALATDNDQATTTSAAVTITATTPNVAPTVSISSPADNAIFMEGEEVTIAATADDSDGTIASVEFFVNDASIGTTSTAPYNQSFTALEGTHDIHVVASDNEGATATSETVWITVNVLLSSFKKNELLIAPNPTSRSIRIETRNDQAIAIKIWDVNGKVKIDSLVSPKSGFIEVSVEGWPKGIYFINAGDKVKEKIILE